MGVKYRQNIEGEYLFDIKTNISKRKRIPLTTKVETILIFNLQTIIHSRFRILNTVTGILRTDLSK